MRLDSLGYRLLWNVRRIFGVENCGPFPIVWRKPRSFEPPAQWREQLSDSQRQRLAIVVKELELLSRIYTYVPQRISAAQWTQFVELPNRHQRFGYVNFLRQKELRKEKDVRRRLAANASRLPPTTTDGRPARDAASATDDGGFKLADNDGGAQRADGVNFLREEDAANEEDGDEDSGGGGGDERNDEPRLFYLPHYCRTRWARQLDGMRFVHAFRLGESPRIAVDCRFLASHSPRGLNLTVLQLAQLVAQNRKRARPWPLYLANFDDTDANVRKQRVANLGIADGPSAVSAEISAKSYLELLPEWAAERRIVYLSPHADDVLERVEHDVCYVIGGIVDRVHEPRIPAHASRLTADAERLPCYRLPLDENVAWKSGSKLLTINGVASILYDVYATAGGSDWKSVLERNVPVRKLRDVSEKNANMRQKYKNLHKFRSEVLKILDEKLPVDDGESEGATASDDADDRRSTANTASVSTAAVGATRR